MLRGVLHDFSQLLREFWPKGDVRDGMSPVILLCVDGDVLCVNGDAFMKPAAIF
jgi:hypothetical protein